MMDRIKEMNSTVGTKMEKYRAYKVGVKILLAAFLLYGLYLFWAVIAFGGGCSRMEPETHILPNKYTGKVYIFFKDKKGEPIRYDKNTRLYRIPDSGVLRLKGKVNKGRTNAEEHINFFYEVGDSLIHLDKLFDYSKVKENDDSSSIVVFEYGIGIGEFFSQGKMTVTTYIVDSLKNFKKRDYKLTKDRFENWK